MYPLSFPWALAARIGGSRFRNNHFIETTVIPTWAWLNITKMAVPYSWGLPAAKQEIKNVIRRMKIKG